ncbi:MAG: MATE family efflux transporter [Bacilli bacterium]
MSQTASLGTEPVGKLLLKYSIPAIIGMLVNGLYNVVDRMFIGNIQDVGAVAMTGVGLTLPIMTVSLAFAMLVGLGAVARISIALGRGEKEEARSYVAHIILLGVVIGAVLTVASLLFLKPLLVLFGATDSTLPYAVDYIRPVLIATIPNMIGFGLFHAIRADGSPKLSAATIIVGCVLNIILDAIFIVGMDMGVAGAGLATAISQSVTALWALYYFTLGKAQLKLTPDVWKFNRTIIVAMVSIGMAPFAMQLGSSLVQVLANQVLLHYGGELAVGAMTVVMSITLFFFMPIFGLNQGAQPIIGYNYGRNQMERARLALRYSMSAAFIFLVLMMLLIQTRADVVVRLFTQDPELMALSEQGIRLFTVMLPLAAIGIVGPMFFQSIGQAKKAMFLSLLRQIIFLIPLFLLLPKWLGLNGIFLAPAVADVLSAGIVTFVLWRFFRQKSSRIN